MITKRVITVLLGGRSSEREVSLRSGAAVANALRGLGHTVCEIDPQDPAWVLPAATDVVFLALHGTYGEDGTIQSELDNLNIPYTGCGSESSSLAFNKALAKQACLATGVPTASFAVLRKPTTLWPSHLNPPVVVKPVRQGSSVGLEFVDHADALFKALSRSLQHDTEVLVEERIMGRETTVAILDNCALPIVEVRPKQGSYDYANKYTAGATEYLCPAPFSPEVTASIQQAGLNAFRAVGGRDYGRVDIMVRGNGEPVVLEVNTLPGMTETSLFPKAAAAAGISYAQLCQKMIDLALIRRS